MSGETEAEPFGWSFDTLYRHISALRDEDQRAVDAAFAAQEKATAAALTASEKAVTAAFAASEKATAAALTAQDKATAAAFAAQEKAIAAALAAAKEANQIQAEEVRVWRIAQNEWRGAMTDREAKFLTRDEGLAKVATEAARFAATFEGMQRQLGDQQKLVDKLDKRMDLREGSRLGITSAMTIGISIIVMVVIIANAFFSNT